MKKLFEEFPAISKVEWQAKIAKDLKGKAISEFDWQLGDGLNVGAFPHREDIAGELPHPISEGQNQWQICEGIQLNDNEETANQLALKSLAGGTNAVRFVCAKTPDFGQLLAGVDLSIVSMHFKVKRMIDPLQFMRSFADFAGKDAQQLNGTLCWQGPASKIDLLNFTNENVPNFRVLPVHGSSFYEDDQSTAMELSKIAKAANDWFLECIGIGGSPEVIALQLFFTVSIGKNYFLQIAKLRALRKFWVALQKKWGIEAPIPAYIFAQFPLSQQSTDANTNLIQATTQVMSAVVGGVDILTVMPSDLTSEDAQPTDFSRRMARNIQHILKLESHFDWVADPAAGSYFIENMTGKLLEGMARV